MCKLREFDFFPFQSLCFLLLYPGLHTSENYFTILNRSGESKHPCFCPYLREKAIKYAASYKFFIDIIYQIAEVSFYF